MRFERWLLPLSSLVAWAATPAWAADVQADASTEAPATPPPEPIGLAFDLRVGYRADSGLDEGSELSASQFETNVSLRRPLGGAWSIGGSLGHGQSVYEASGDGPIGQSGLAVTVQTTQLFGHLEFQSFPGFGFFVGPTLELAVERGARLADGLMGGGFGGVTWVVDPSLVLGLGATVTTQLEDGLQVLPIVVLDWRMTEALRLTTNGRYGPGGSLELVAGHAFVEAALAVSYLVDQYRLEGGGAVPRGVVKESRLPVWLRVSGRITEQLRADLYVETAFAGRFELVDRSGAAEETTYDPYLSLGLNLAASF